MVHGTRKCVFISGTFSRCHSHVGDASNVCIASVVKVLVVRTHFGSVGVRELIRYCKMFPEYVCE